MNEKRQRQIRISKKDGKQKLMLEKEKQEILTDRIFIYVV